MLDLCLILIWRIFSTNRKGEVCTYSSHAAGSMGQILLNSADIDTNLPRAFVEKFIYRFKDEGLEDIVSQTIKNILTTMRTMKISEDYQPCLRVI